MSLSLFHSINHYYLYSYYPFNYQMYIYEKALIFYYLILVDLLHYY